MIVVAVTKTRPGDPSSKRVFYIIYVILVFYLSLSLDFPWIFFSPIMFSSVYVMRARKKINFDYSQSPPPLEQSSRARTHARERD